MAFLNFSSSPVSFLCVVAMITISQRGFVPQDFFLKVSMPYDSIQQTPLIIVSLATKPLSSISLNEKIYSGMWY